MTAPSYPLDELPPNHKALVELVQSLKVGKIIVTDETIVIEYTDRNRPIFVKVSKNVSSNSRKPDGTP